MVLDNIKKADAPENHPIANISWSAPQIVNTPKSNLWYWIVALIALGLAVAFYFMKNYFGIAVVVIAPIVFYIIGREQHPKSKYTLTEESITVNEKIYLYKDLKSYWLTEGPLFSTLYIETTKKLLPPLSIYLIGVDPLKVKNAISQHLPENKNKKEPAADRVSKLLGF